MTDLPSKLRELAESLRSCEWNHPLTSADTCDEAAKLIEVAYCVPTHDTAIRRRLAWPVEDRPVRVPNLRQQARRGLPVAGYGRNEPRMPELRVHDLPTCGGRK